MKFFTIIEVRKIWYFFNKIVEVSLSLDCYLWTIFIESISRRNWGYKTPRPSFHHCNTHFKEFFKSSADVNFTIFILTTNDIDTVLRKSTASCFGTSDRDFYLISHVFIGLKGVIGVDTHSHNTHLSLIRFRTTIFSLLLILLLIDWLCVLLSLIFIESFFCLFRGRLVVLLIWPFFVIIVYCLIYSIVLIVLHFYLSNDIMLRSPNY